MVGTAEPTCQGIGGRVYCPGWGVAAELDFSNNPRNLRLSRFSPVFSGFLFTAESKMSHDPLSAPNTSAHPRNRRI